MTKHQFTEHIKNIDVKKMGKKPVVVLPLAVWRKIEGYLEDWEVGQSRSLAAKIKKARSQTRLYSASEVKKLIGI